LIKSQPLVAMPVKYANREYSFADESGSKRMKLAGQRPPASIRGDLLLCFLHRAARAFGAAGSAVAAISCECAYREGQHQGQAHQGRGKSFHHNSPKIFSVLFGLLWTHDWRHA
jgi:hypothetical protein